MVQYTVLTTIVFAALAAIYISSGDGACVARERKNNFVYHVSLYLSLSYFPIYLARFRIPINYLHYLSSFP
jgi:hypothetical protein